MVLGPERYYNEAVTPKKFSNRFIIRRVKFETFKKISEIGMRKILMIEIKQIQSEFSTAELSTFLSFGNFLQTNILVP